MNSLYKFAIMIWLLFGLHPIAYAYPSRSAASLNNFNSVRKLESRSLSALPFRTEDTFTIFDRDLSPDILASSVPVSSIQSHNKEDVNSNHNGLLLRSSSSNVSGVGGYPIFALPIMSSDLAEILSKTQADLQMRKGDLPASFYHVNTTDWSFWVTIANTTLHYDAIKAVVTRFLKLAFTTATPQDILSTRVGVILNNMTPIANIAIIPSRSVNNDSDIPFSNFGDYGPSTSQSNEVFQITPFGSTCAYQDVNETAALAPYLDHHSLIKHQDISPRSLETDMLAPFTHTALQVVYRLWRDPVYGLPVEVKLWAVKGALHIALWACSNLLLHELFNPMSPTQVDTITKKWKDANYYQNCTFDTGYYTVGRLMARLVIENAKKSEATDPLTAMLKLNIEIIEAVMKPMEGMDPQDDAFAMEGEVYGPSNVTSRTNSTTLHEEGGREVVARWQLSVKDKEEL